MAQITKLRITDFLGIESLTLSEVGKVNIITGPNGAGKSSVLKAIQAAFKSTGQDTTVIRAGAKASEIFLQLDNGVDIKRRVTEKANTAKVTVGDDPVRTPQAFLKELFGIPFIFNPVEFLTLDTKGRRELLLQALPITVELGWLREALGERARNCRLDHVDFSGHGLEVLAGIRQQVHDRRHEVGVQKTQKEKSIDEDRASLPETATEDKFAGFDFAAETAAIGEARAAVAEHEADEARIAKLRQQKTRIATEIDQLKTRITELESELSEIITEGQDLRNKIDEYQPPDVEGIQSRLNEYDEFRAYSATLDGIKRKEQQAEALAEEYDELNKTHQQLRVEIPQQLLATADLPVDNLDLTGEDILIDGIPIDKRSTSEQVTFCIQVARIAAGDLECICVDDLEHLDSERRAAVLKEMEEDRKFGYFVTMVTDTEKLEVECR
jgi:DNA repair exonuclease SbcCD ATPase subunit